MGSGATSRLDLEFPIGTDPAAIPTDIEGLADGLDNIVAPWVQSTSAPVSPVKGTLWWNPTVTASTFGFNYYDGISWWNILSGPQYIGSSAPAASACYPGLLWANTSFTCTQLQICTAGGSSPTWLILIPGSNTTGQALINTGSGIAWGTVPGTGLPLSGGTMTGPLILSGNATMSLGAVTLQQLLASVLTLPVNAVLKSPIETSYISSTALTGTLGVYVTTNGTSILLTANATGNFVFNVASTSSVALNTLLAVGQEITLAIKTTQGSTPYYCTSIEIDGVAQTVNWQGGTAPTFGNPSGIDVYTINITKTASATYTVLASQVQF